MVRKKKILVTADWCEGCPYAKERLKDAGIKFRAVNVDSKEGQKLDKKHHFTAVPTMVINGKKVNNIKKWFD